MDEKRDGMDENNDEMSGISRRSAIKRIGVGAAVVWSAPAIVSVSRAYGQARSPVPCGEPFVCGEPDPFNCSPDPAASCLCFADANRDVNCVRPTVCADECTTNEDCGPGRFCTPNANTCCGGTGGTCNDPCAAGGAAAAEAARGPGTQQG